GRDGTDNSASAPRSSASARSMMKLAALVDAASWIVAKTAVRASLLRPSRLLRFCGPGRGLCSKNFGGDDITLAEHRFSDTNRIAAGEKTSQMRDGGSGQMSGGIIFGEGERPTAAHRVARGKGPARSGGMSTPAGKLMMLQTRAIDGTARDERASPAT